MKATPGVEIEVTGTLGFVGGKMWVYSLNSLSNPYYRLLNRVTDELADENASAMGDAATVTWGNSAITPTNQKTTRGGLLLDIPSYVPDGWYDLTIYDNASPASTDTLQLGRVVNIKDGFIQSFDNR
jgi:hypothetical protein